MKVNQVTVSREELALRYDEILFQNPLLQRVERECKAINWTDEEIRTFQLLIACASNASLKQRISELERHLGGQSNGGRRMDIH